MTRMTSTRRHPKQRLGNHLPVAPVPTPRASQPLTVALGSGLAHGLDTLRCLPAATATTLWFRLPPELPPAAERAARRCRMAVLCPSLTDLLFPPTPADA
jgi:hypothetical protein